MAVITLLPGMAFAADDGPCGSIGKFAGSIHTLLNGLSIVVVTIAVIFSGYQIAFAHKRIGDVAPVLIGAVLIGAAGQIANMFLGDSTTDCTTTSVEQVIHVLSLYV